jgi:hypothetical protein
MLEYEGGLTATDRSLRFSGAVATRLAPGLASADPLAARLASAALPADTSAQPVLPPAGKDQRLFFEQSFLQNPLSEA